MPFLACFQLCFRSPAQWIYAQAAMKIGECELELPPTRAGQSGKPRIPKHQPQASPYERIPAHRLSPHCQTTNRVRADQLASLPALPTAGNSGSRCSPASRSTWPRRRLTSTCTATRSRYWWTFGRRGAARAARWHRATCRLQPSCSPTCEL